MQVMSIWTPRSDIGGDGGMVDSTAEYVALTRGRHSVAVAMDWGPRL